MRLRLFGLMVMIVMVACGCFSDAASERAKQAINDKIAEMELRAKDTVGLFKVAEESDPVEGILRNMTLEEKVGQMVMIGVQGDVVDDNIKYLLSTYKMGGVILFDRNMDSKEQVREFVGKLNANSGQALPLFISIDEEGGQVVRMKHDLTPPPSQESIGMGGNASDARTYAKITAQKLKDIGVNVNFAPVADVGTRDTRSFGDNAGVVAEFVSNAAKGYGDAQLFYCLKHFPGIGKGVIDSHVDISSIDADLDTLRAEDILPFRKIIDEQDNSEFMVMVSHLRYDAIDSERSASLSGAVITDLLRNELGFDGVVITDDLEMGATANYLKFVDVGVMAVEAGADIALVCHEYDHQKEVCDGILYAVRSGEISEERIDESVRRIIRMKMRLGEK